MIKRTQFTDWGLKIGKFPPSLWCCQTTSPCQRTDEAMCNPQAIKSKGQRSYRLGCVWGYIFWLHRTGKWWRSRGTHRTTKLAYKKVAQKHLVTHYGSRTAGNTDRNSTKICVHLTQQVIPAVCLALKTSGILRNYNWVKLAEKLANKWKGRTERCLARISWIEGWVGGPGGR